MSAGAPRAGRASLDARPFTFTVIGKIVPAVRMTRRSKYVSRQAGRYLAYKEQIGWTAKAAGATVVNGPIALSVTAYAMKRRWDASNVLKAVEDALNGVCWVDDKQVVAISVRVFDVLPFPGVNECVVVRVMAA